MDEQNDQAVLEIKNETDMNDDYLSILREMQQSLNADGELTPVPPTISEEFGIIPDQVLDVASPQAFTENLQANNKFAVPAEESDAADYFANAKTQPLPELATDFNGGSNKDEKGEANFEDASTFSAKNASASETAMSNDSESVNFAESAGELGSDNQSFSYFAEMLPILFDSNEQIDVVEPNFETDLLVGAANETTLELTMEIPPVNASDNLSKILATDEMPNNLAFGEMFAEDSVKPASAANQTPIDIDEKAEITLLKDLETKNLGVTESLNKSVPSFEQNFEKHDLEKGSADSLEIKSVEASNDYALEFGLPEAMLLGKRADTFAPEPSFDMLSDAEAELADETVLRSQLFEETQAEDLGEESLAVPSFLKAELMAAKQSAAEERLPLPETSANVAQDKTTELKSPENENFADAPLSITDGEHYEMLASDSISPATTINNSGSNDLIVAAEAQEMPETALFENLNAETSEIDYPDDFLEDYSEASLNNTSESLQTDAPESLSADNFKTEMPEIDFAEFDLPTAPAVANFDAPPAQDSSPKADLEGSRQNSVARSLLQEMSDLPKSVSFLKERFVIFKLDGTLYGLPAVNVAEIGQILPITPLPFVPSWFLGISNLRGDILSVIGLRELWEKNAASSHKAKILVVHSEKQALTVGLVVDAVREMRHVAPEDIFSDDSSANSHFAPYQIGTVEYEGQSLCLLNAEKLLETLRS